MNASQREVEEAEVRLILFTFLLLALNIIKFLVRAAACHMYLCCHICLCCEFNLVYLHGDYASMRREFNGMGIISTHGLASHNAIAMRATGLHVFYHVY